METGASACQNEVEQGQGSRAVRTVCPGPQPEARRLAEHRLLGEPPPLLPDCPDRHLDSAHACDTPSGQAYSSQLLGKASRGFNI